MMRFAPFLFAFAVLLAPLASRAEGDARPVKENAAKAKVKKVNKKKQIDETSTQSTRPTKAARTLRPNPLHVNVRQGHEINEDVHVVAFPTQATHVKKAFAQNRRDSLDDAERTARADQQADRWWTVLFHLRSLDSRNDPEACFWRVVAYYRLGELARARALRSNCELPTADGPLLDSEDAMSSSLQPAAALPEMLAAGEKAPEPIVNPARYAGQSPPR
jgi:hypothetical protein